ncbi:thioredoxin family protein, partial [Candidatus Gracilibacteria bacterium]|nr:thioredoxin family protein [Candidatus Gracilibacteria bacterium]
ECHWGLFCELFSGVLCHFGNRPSRELFVGTDQFGCLRPRTFCDHVFDRIFGTKSRRQGPMGSQPQWSFSKILGVIFLIVGLTILMSWDKAAESWLLDHGFNITRVEESLLKKFEITNQETKTPVENLNITPDTQSTFPFTEKYTAPELSGLENWINSDGYTSIADLKGKVVLIDFWTYSCINCIRTLPYLQELHEKYADQGLVILGIHAPEFAFEKKFENVREATTKFGLTYPVVQDNDFKTWRNYENHYWPAKYLIDKDGFVRYHHFGEGKYEETEKAVAALLETDVANVAGMAQKVNFSEIKTPETYLGTRRRENKVEANQELSLNQWKLAGSWQEDGESVFSSEFPASIFLHFSAAKANIVMGGNATAEIYIDGTLSQTITIGMEQLYNVADFGEEYGEHEIEIRFISGENVKLYAWTFG